MSFVFNIAICDDDDIFVDELFSLVLKFMDDNRYECNIDTFYDGNELLTYCKKNIPDVILIDIDMPSLNGFQITSEIQNKNSDVFIIFVSAHEEYAIQAYDYQPYWFVSKNKIYKIDQVLNKLVKKISCMKTNKEVLKLTLENGEIININKFNVLYFISCKHYLISHLVDGRTIKFRCSVKYAYDNLKEYGFIYVNKSCIANCRFIDRFESKYIIMQNEEIISLSRNRIIINEAQKLFSKYMRDSRW